MTWTTLWRPVGGHELALIIAERFLHYPPRLPEQPIFYPVCNRRYAEEIAFRWNLDDPNSAFSGFVTEFSVPTTLADQYAREVVGAAHHEELWVPAADQRAFCDAMQAPIQVVAARLGDRFPEISNGWDHTGEVTPDQLPALIHHIATHGLAGGPLTQATL